jgi:hypothetical protein
MSDKFVFIKNEGDDRMLVYWIETNTLITIPKPKFIYGQFVQTSNKHYSQKSFTRLLDQSYTDTRGWVYVENYVDRDGRGGGCGMWNDEFQYSPLTDPLDILIAEKLTALSEVTDLKVKIKDLEHKINMLETSIGIINTALGKDVSDER